MAPMSSWAQPSSFMSCLILASAPTALAVFNNQVGPIAIGPVPTTVHPTPRPAVHPTPGVYYPLVPLYGTKLTRVKLPKGLQRGVASSAFQVEVVAKNEGKGPSTWDLLSHCVPKQVANNTTGDVVAEHYLYD
ncbi:glycoside hydrolase family 1 protein [Lepidopterella palustris CBS 459.81]|uniref:Glycoside hydrolase family 1 protein n=1 Tax=Lepidopterella palustris CBS 459.81 TaxID=1314670 RepID=A0A8E2EAZ0_9PEZI|nr:glycoside hydrolase family 1 protein [Lepidopterella palustris CBS 459.81]